MPRNENDRPHGFWECYHSNGDLAYKCYCQDGIIIGYREYYMWDGTPDTKTFFLR